MSAMKEVWDALRAVVGIADKMQDLSTELRELRRRTRRFASAWSASKPSSKGPTPPAAAVDL